MELSDISLYLLCAVFGLISLWYIRFTKDFNYWKKQGVPGNKPKLIIGTFKPTWRNSFQEQDMEAMKKFGHIHGEFVGNEPVLFISDPELLKQIFVKDFNVFPSRRVLGSMKNDKVISNMLSALTGEPWKTVRNTLTPTYTTGKLKQMVYLIEECTNSLIETLQRKSENGEPIEFTRVFPVLTLDIIASCAFGMKADCIKNPDTEFVVKAQKVFRSSPILSYFTVLFNFFFKLFPGILPRPFAYFAEIANKTIDLRLQNNDKTRRDFLQIMLEAEIPNENLSQANSDGITAKKTLSRDVIVSQTVLFLLAGHETTATTLNFMAYELAVNEVVQEKVIKEVDEVMADSKGKLAYDAVTGMKYLDMVISETLRKYPPAIRTDRVCFQDGYTINGITLREGINVGIPIYAIHHNPEFFPDPSKFDPERFSAENKANRNQFTYLPFGAGPRSCIAMRFALMEIKLVMVQMLSHYRFQTCKTTEFPINLAKGSILLQPKSVLLTLQKRDDQLHFH